MVFCSLSVLCFVLFTFIFDMGCFFALFFAVVVLSEVIFSLFFFGGGVLALFASYVLFLWLSFFSDATVCFYLVCF